MFLWNSRPDSSCPPPFLWHSSVSILVFVELAPGRRWRSLRASALPVSILVFVELAPGHGCARCTLRHLLVSILVFVELAPGPRRHPDALPHHRKVSILVFVELAPGQRYNHRRGPTHVQFQSLFLWNSRPDNTVPGLSRMVVSSFNPCFCGTRARTHEIDWFSCKPFHVSILVFVELAPGLDV